MHNHDSPSTPLLLELVHIASTKLKHGSSIEVANGSSTLHLKNIFSTIPHLNKRAS
jgi:hypothetical protein